MKNFWSLALSHAVGVLWAFKKIFTEVENFKYLFHQVDESSRQKFRNTSDASAANWVIFGLTTKSKLWNVRSLSPITTQDKNIICVFARFLHIVRRRSFSAGKHLTLEGAFDYPRLCLHIKSHPRRCVPPASVIQAVSGAAWIVIVLVINLN